MLRSLYVKNYALIEEVQVEFKSGLNIITGETGAGKSILIDALGLILGERASSEVVRKGADKTVVEGIFYVGGNKKIKKILEDNGIEFSDELILRREVSAKGQSRCFANDSPISLAVMKEIGNHLVDLHGQHEHQSLLRVETHIELLDDFGGLLGMVEEFRKEIHKLENLYKQLDELKQKEKLLKEKKELYEFQLKEIETINPQVGEIEELESELRLLENAEKLYEATAQLYSLLYGSEKSIHDLLVVVRNQLEDLSAIDKRFQSYVEEARSAQAIVDEITSFIQSYNSRIEFNPERLEFIRERLHALNRLKKKYGGTIESVIEYRDKIRREFELAENFEDEITKVEKKIDEQIKICSEVAERLSLKRREVAETVSKIIVGVLAELGIDNAQFEVKIENRPKKEGRCYVRLGKECYEVTSRGIDFVEFYISTNIGEDLKPLVKVASGGEVSRIMLALKSVLAKSERLPLLVFDEIDTGISGRIAQKVGQSLKNLSRYHQIIVITHLPQIASLADTHFVAEKVIQDGRAVTKIRELEIEERIREIAKLMSGEEVTQASIESAKELMGLKK
ncbi:DNA replication and repair protein RecN [Candidatus Kryptobacter tengchongensis]|uniref:DNA repair protein RecN n=1 Tax=Kryptobacter tengchongensis TaxID=1643429 RepID=A0A656D414_KRYT1|nr:DNA repair protein RecN [Candidatus Kryptobacter tengchongensis]CUS99232.1 DNA replication and repair protein RecN [Candidatus Kryptobacter tengchongensis]CUU06183.1 DNA replication and repair protein RecN [Candidatus Kryptobacter tengchongensis]